MTSGTGYSIGTSIPGTWSAAEIVYCVFSYSGNNVSGYSYSYNSSSGVKSGNNISGFISSIISNSVGTLNPLHTDPIGGPYTAPSIVVTQPCYIVIQLSNADWDFESGTVAFTTGDNHASDYFGLTYVDTSGNATTSPPSSTCKIIYFCVNNPPTDEDDAFNLFTSNQYGLLKVDPAIKNRGGN
jgi:hypothetical protein